MSDNELAEFFERGRRAQQAINDLGAGPTVVVYPRGVRTEVRRDVCRCPILHVGDGCPVHQQLPDDMGTRRQDVPQQLYLTKAEIAVLLLSLAQAVTPLRNPLDVIEISEASRVVWESPVSTPMQRSLATALAEALH